MKRLIFYKIRKHNSRKLSLRIEVAVIQKDATSEKGTKKSTNFLCTNNTSSYKMTIFCGL